MKIYICSSLSFTDEALALAEELKKLGHEPILPYGIRNRAIEQPDFDPVVAKTTTDNMNKDIDLIGEADALLDNNLTKNGIENYIGANALIELAAAHYYGKKIFTLNPLPDIPYIHDELHAFTITVLDGDLGKIS